jgi:membrane-associated phospholipid phosphatase
MTGALAAAPVSAQARPSNDDPGPAAQFFKDVAGDYIHFFSKDTAIWLGTGGGLALAVHPADEAIRDATQGTNTFTTSLEGGQWYGQGFVQIPVALAWWTIGHAAGSARGAAAGRDLTRAQILTAAWTFPLKIAVGRTRPNGEPRSFPSGHASASFATAMVLEDHYGWKVGVPAFAAAAYTAASRLTDNKHWASDVVFGAFLGVASARTVTIHLRKTDVTVAPQAAPRGAGVLVQVRRAGS